MPDIKALGLYKVVELINGNNKEGAGRGEGISEES